MVLPRVPPLLPARPEEILLPVRRWFILLTLALALAANLLPFSGVVLALRPDFLALTLLYWCIREPASVDRRMGRATSSGRARVAARTVTR